MEQIYRIAIDHGYGNIKTAHHIFESGVIEREKESELAGMTVEYGRPDSGVSHKMLFDEIRCGTVPQNN